MGNRSGELRIDGLTSEDHLERSQQRYALLGERGEIVPDPAECLSPTVCMERTGHLRLDFGHAQVALGLVLTERNRQDVQKRQDVVLSEHEAVEQAVRWGLLDPATLPWASMRWRIGGGSRCQEVQVTGDEVLALLDG